MKKAIVFGGLLILTLLGFSYAFAQAGGGFDLSWFTIDGGGGISTGGDFSLSGTIGQPDAGVLSGGDFTLNGGFWHCTTAVVTSPDITASGSDVQLAWASNVLIANIYRASNDPYFTPGGAYALNQTSVWTDAGAAGTVGSNYTYIIRANGDCGESGNSKRLGEFDFAITPGS